MPAIFAENPAKPWPRCWFRWRWAISLMCGAALVAGCGVNSLESARTQLARLGMTNSPAAFIKAAHKGDLVAVRLFLKAGMDANSRIETGAGSVTALHAAVDGGNKEIVALLLQKGADVNATAFGKDTPLHVALGRTNSNLALVQLLLNNGANVNAVRETGGTPLMQAVVVGNVEAIGLLLSKGADVNAKEIEGYTALMFAALDGDLEVVKSLLKAKPDLEAKAGSGGRTALEMARAKGHSNVVEVLIAAEKAGTSTPAARVAYEDREKARLKLGQMGLQFTADDFIRKGVWNDDTVAVKAFLDAGMDVNSTVPNQDGGTWTALAFAAEKGNPELVKLLLSRGAKVTTELFDEASGGNLETAKLLVQQGAPTRVGYDELYGWGKAPLYNAVYKGHVDVVRFLLEHRAYAPNFESAASLDYAKSFMGTAIDQCQVEVVKVLLEHKVDCGTSETTALALKEAKEMAELTPQNSTFYKDATKSKQILELVAEAFPQKTP